MPRSRNVMVDQTETPGINERQEYLSDDYRHPDRYIGQERVATHHSQSPGAAGPREYIIATRYDSSPEASDTLDDSCYSNGRQQQQQQQRRLGDSRGRYHDNSDHHHHHHHHHHHPQRHSDHRQYYDTGDGGYAVGGYHGDEYADDLSTASSPDPRIEVPPTAHRYWEDSEHTLNPVSQSVATHGSRYDMGTADGGAIEGGESSRNHLYRTDSVKTATTSRHGNVMVETMAAPHPCCPNTKSVCCLMLLLNLSLILFALGLVIVLQLFRPPFVWYIGVVLLTAGLAALLFCLVYCVWVCRDARRYRAHDGNLYWTHHWRKQWGSSPPAPPAAPVSAATSASGRKQMR